jgi:hypothetical protein
MYDITVLGRAERTLLIALQGLVEEWSPDLAGPTLTMRVDDQSALIAVLTALHDLGVPIEAVRRVR